ncbi:MAG: penicillin-binding protein 2 [Desulfuromonadaceae bacterium]|nr:penicillin-binding protein 2 [Desulfuromonadaceae bacterium]
MPLNAPQPDDIGRRRRFEWLLVAAALFFLLLALRLWYLQVISGERYDLQSQKNRTRYLPIAAPRGIIYDRNGEILVGNRPSFTLSVLRQDVVDRDRLLSDLAQDLDLDREFLEQAWENQRYYPRYRPIPLKRDISREQVERLAENGLHRPGMLIEVQPTRAYPHGELAAHLFGYIGAISEEELRQPANHGYRAGDYIGKNGVEKNLEQYLRGQDGERLVEVDVQGEKLRQRVQQPPLPGKRAYLTLDLALQQQTERAFGDQSGAAVALDVHSGAILAMVSRPAFSPALFTDGISSRDWQTLLNDPDHPLQARAISGQYPPGSTFKMVTALAALHDHVTRTGEVIDCEGRIALGNRDFRCWKKTGHGPTNLKKALRESCDVWFYEIALRVGIDRIAGMARQLGLGRHYDLPLDNERDGLIPDKEWKRRRHNTPWYPGETAIAGIGQGYVLATPLQLAVMTATVANGGTLYRPQLIERIEEISGNVLLQRQPAILHTATFDKEDLLALRQGLEAVVDDPRGTGKACRLPGIRVAGKTGTAQVVRMKDDPAEGEDPTEKEEIAYRLRDHALFVAYAPADKPEIAVAVIVEHGQHGSSAAAPIARAMFEQYFDLPATTAPLPGSE